MHVLCVLTLDAILNLLYVLLSIFQCHGAPHMHQHRHKQQQQQQQHKNRESVLHCLWHLHQQSMTRHEKKKGWWGGVGWVAGATLRLRLYVHVIFDFCKGTVSFSLYWKMAPSSSSAIPSALQGPRAP